MVYPVLHYTPQFRKADHSQDAQCPHYLEEPEKLEPALAIAQEDGQPISYHDRQVRNEPAAQIVDRYLGKPQFISPSR
eukprot:2192776-Amphidinium_carterae.1